MPSRLTCTRNCVNFPRERVWKNDPSIPGKRHTHKQFFFLANVLFQVLVLRNFFFPMEDIFFFVYVNFPRDKLKKKKRSILDEELRVQMYVCIYIDYTACFLIHFYFTRKRRNKPWELEEEEKREKRMINHFSLTHTHTVRETRAE